MTSQISVLILGAGCFGLSTALELLSRGYKNVTLIDRAPELPAPDAASTDLNKIVRSAYRKDAYTRLARESIKEWKTGDWDHAYHESGILGGGATGTPYSRAAQENDIAAGGRVTLLPTVESIKSIFPAGITIGEIAEAEDRGQGITAKNSCYLNADGGWVEATTAMKALLRKVRAYEGHGVNILAGCRVTGLEIDADGSAAGVKIVRNEEQDQGKEGVLKADVIVLATGAWSSSLFPDDSFGLSRLMKATGQSVLSVQLTPEELAKYSTCPSFFDTATGLYTMPPTASGLLKWGLHHTGALSSHKVSTPRTGLAADNTAPLNPNAKIGVDGAGVPCALIETLRQVAYVGTPTPSTKTGLSTTTQITRVYSSQRGALATHSNVIDVGEKFLPVLGRVIADRLENKLDKESNELFSFTRPRSAEHVERVGEHIRIDETQLSTTADLRGVVA
ncbi:FAD-binding domain protein [Ceratobasidium sp. AG-Ba]|nr:FAD-binding domain protein [Ceratobasidium sp. AG-Ba]